MPLVRPNKDLFEDDVTFPSFADAADRYPLTGHCCFLGEIVSIDFIVRLRLVLKDRTGASNVVMAFYDDKSGATIYPKVKVGYSIALCDPGNAGSPGTHQFLDGSMGFRIENDTFKRLRIMPCKLDNLLKASDMIRRVGDGKKCDGCGKEKVDGGSLDRCAACKAVCYCNKVIMHPNAGTVSFANSFVTRNVK